MTKRTSISQEMLTSTTAPTGSHEENDTLVKHWLKQGYERSSLNMNAQQGIHIILYLNCAN